jgi:glycerophosphoryl diester phosphodiesterase
MPYYLSFVLLFAALPAQANDTIWNFERIKNPLLASEGRGRIKPINDTAVQTGTPRQYKLAPLHGGKTRVLKLSAFTSTEGFKVRHKAKPNGVLRKDKLVSNYTFVMDVYWPERDWSVYRALLQTDVENTDEADIFVRLGKAGGLGTRDNYGGPIHRKQWHRVAWVVRAAEGRGGVGMIHKFVDGHFVGGQNTHGKDKRWALRKEFLLFTDKKGYTGEGYVSSIRFSPRAWTIAEVEELRGVHARGTGYVGPKPKPAKNTPRHAGIIAHRGASCCAPENTIAAIERAFLDGADHVEVDVQRSVDGEAFLLHDSRLNRTTNGRGNASHVSLRGLRKLDAGSWFGREFKGVHVPSLVEALLAAKGKGRLMLDIKDKRLGPAIAQALIEAGVGPEAVWFWQNDNAESAKHFTSAVPGAEVAWGSVPKDLSLVTFQKFKKMGVVGFDVDHKDITPAFVAAAHRHKMFVSAYTVKNRDDLTRLLQMGVDFIETDYPAQMRAWMPRQ